LFQPDLFVSLNLVKPDIIHNFCWLAVFYESLFQSDFWPDFVHSAKFR